MTADERRRLRRSIWLLVAVFVAVGLLDTAADHEPIATTTTWEVLP